MASVFPGETWDEMAERFERARREAIERGEAQTDGAAECINGYVRHFLTDVRERHSASLEAMVASPTPVDVDLDHSGVRLTTGRGNPPEFHANLLAVEFRVTMDGRWGFYYDTGDDYIPQQLVFGYDEDHQLVDLRRNFATYERALTAARACPEVLRVLVACARSDW
jgi:hypothetical protein